MIADAVVEGVKDYLAAGATTPLSTVTFSERDDGADLAYPAVIVKESGEPEEHDIIKGQWTVGVEVMLKTRPEGDEAAVTHRAINAQINDKIGDSAALVAALGSTVECHDSWGGQGATEEDDGFRMTTFGVEVKAATL